MIRGTRKNEKQYHEIEKKEYDKKQCDKRMNERKYDKHRCIFLCLHHNEADATVCLWSGTNNETSCICRKL